MEPTIPPRYHITDGLWNSFTVEGVNKSIDALSKRGDLKHPKAFTVRLSAKAIWDMSPDAFEADSEKDQAVTDSLDEFINGRGQWFFDFHCSDCKDGSVDSYYVTHTTKRFRPEVPLQDRDLYLSAKKKVMQKHLPDDDVSIRGWWEKNYACIECVANGSVFEFWNDTFPQLVAAVLIICLHERTVQRVMVEASKPKSGIAKKLAARRGGQPDTAPETILYVPARFYKPGSGTSTHALKHLHYRNLHWRRQPYGSRANPTYKDVWIEGMFINATDCTEAEKAEVTIRPRNFKLLG